jgi:hypothetical protein
MDKVLVLLFAFFLALGFTGASLFLTKKIAEAEQKIAAGQQQLNKGARAA